MTKKKEKGWESKHNEVTTPTVYSNSLGIGYSDAEVVINFGLSTPTYFEPHEDEDVPVARIVLSWEGVETLLDALKEVLDEHKKPKKTNRKVKSKSRRSSGE